MSQEEPPPQKRECIDCRYWNMWENNCVLMCLFHDDYAPVPPHTPACPDYKPEDPDPPKLRRSGGG